MELKEYAAIVWKRIWIPLGLMVMVGGISLALAKTPPPSYSTSMRFTVGVTPKDLPDQYTYDTYYAWLASEYLVDDMTGLVSSQVFADNVNRHLREMNSAVQIPPGSIGGVTIGGKQHRILSLSVTWGNPDELVDIAQAIVLTMEQDGTSYLAQLGSSTALVQLIDAPSPPGQNPQSLTQRLDVPIRMFLALAVGLALTFVLDYLDESVRHRADLEALGVAVLAEIPRK
jgi:capsular polysaccharide biosynthesis protein